MPSPSQATETPIAGIVFAGGQRPVSSPGDQVRILTRSPIGHYRVPTSLRGKAGRVASVIEPAAIDNEQEGYGRNAGSKRHCYRIAIPMTEIWPDYAGSPRAEWPSRLACPSKAWCGRMRRKRPEGAS